MDLEKKLQDLKTVCSDEESSVDQSLRCQVGAAKDEPDYDFSVSSISISTASRKNIARIANAVQVTICLLVSTSVY